MPILRLWVLSPLGFAVAVFATVQNQPANQTAIPAIGILAPFSAQQTGAQQPSAQQPGPQQQSSAPSPELRLRFPDGDQSRQTSVRIFQLPQDLGEAALLGGSDLVGNSPLLSSNSTCYFIQAYRFAQTKPGSDASKLVDVSTCQPAAQYQMRNAVSSRSVPNR